MKRISVLFSMVMSFAAFAIPVDLSQTKSQVEFLAVGQPSALKIRGKLTDGKGLGGKLEFIDGKLTGTATLALDGFDTGIALRNRHMKEKYLETGKFPESTVTLKPIALTGDVSQPQFQWTGPFEATLRLHGVDKPVTGTAEVKKQDGKWSGEFRFEFALQDYGIEVPSYLGITVSKAVQVQAVFQQ